MFCLTQRRRQPRGPSTHHQHLAAILDGDIHSLSEQALVQLVEVVDGCGVFAVFLPNAVKHPRLLPLLVPKAPQEAVDSLVIVLLKLTHHRNSRSNY